MLALTRTKVRLIFTLTSTERTTLLALFPKAPFECSDCARSRSTLGKVHYWHWKNQRPVYILEVLI